MLTEIVFYAVPGVLDVAGLGAEADEFRTAAPCVGEVVSLLRRVADEVSGRWAPVVREMCFWAEAYVWAEWSGNLEDLEDLRERFDRAISEGYALMAMH